MFEPGDEVTPICAPSQDSWAYGVIEFGKVYVVEEFFPAGVFVPRAGVVATYDVLNFVGVNSFQHVWPFVLYGWNAAMFRKVERKRDLIERLMAAPVGGHPDDERDTPIRKRVHEPA